ncbi:hypothetical protein Rsub_11433 [Raphidocelis subcapitata]|uniref:protein-L-isoaspartate(D-aspartate) O-methyltransferase n=1 Tax=Raphidocelis subcapitata TaxID=307507 RepID=A0A2V0PHI5_9CHLO|nr:hypothetical protein Rsub_11433 [Raphidocelis subcapitata]|eukprot:GBF99226.1 hypothetical protein Rsub_11433 [Raphidocelis subcapitata]
MDHQDEPRDEPGRAERGEEDEEGRPERRQRVEEGDLNALLRILARQRVLALAERARAATHADLIRALRENGMLTSEEVAAAMLAVPRGSFVPAEYRAEAYTDAPIRVEGDGEDGWNISAPHMHASMLEALRLRPGDRFLDVGCGCGYLAAAAAMLVGPSGRVAGLDTRSYCVELAEDNTARLRDTSPDYAAAACEAEFERHNAFLPSSKYRGRFNKVCIGAACPEERVHLLLQLLSDEPGSLLLAPVETDLRLYERRRDGSARFSVVSSVRFSELEVPTDATVALAAADDARRAALAVAVSGSTYASDMERALAAGASDAAGEAPAGAEESGGGGDGELSSSGALANGAAAAGAAAAGAGPGGGGGGEAAFARVSAQLGAPDYVLVGAGWQLAAHRAVLQARCPHFRARLTSGMRDANGASATVPEAFPQRSIEALLRYLYTDTLPPGLDPPALADLLHAGCFYGCSSLLQKAVRTGGGGCGMNAPFLTPQPT